MPGFTSPGLFFIGTVVPQEMHFLRRVFEGARTAGYTRFVEPAAGAFAMCGLARSAGWLPEQMETSDVAFFTSVLGYAAMGERLDDLDVRINAEGFEDVDLGDPAQVLWAQMACRYLVRAEKSFYWEEIVKDLRLRREEITEDVNRQLDRARSTLRGFSYRPRCMFAHLEEVMADPAAIISLNPPTHAGGWEKFYSTGGRLEWREPTYAFFDPKKDMVTIADMARDAKALLVLYEETLYGESVLPGVFSRAGAMKAPGDSGPVRTMNTYLSSNRPEELSELAGGRKVTRRAELDPGPSQFPIIPPDYAFKPDCKIRILPLEERHAYYYRSLWQHRFMGKVGGASPLGVVIDGYIAGVLAFNQEKLALGEYGRADGEGFKSLFLQYGMAARTEGCRLNRLLTKLALSRQVMRMTTKDQLMARVELLVTAQFTKHPESKEMRGLMKMQARRPVTKQYGLDKGFMLRYSAPAEDTTPEEAFKWWVKDEERYRLARTKSMSSPTSDEI